MPHKRETLADTALAELALCHEPAGGRRPVTERQTFRWRPSLALVRDSAHDAGLASSELL